jgi:hypothetical protein
LPLSLYKSYCLSPKKDKFWPNLYQNVLMFMMCNKYH